MVVPVAETCGRAHGSISTRSSSADGPARISSSRRSSRCKRATDANVSHRSEIESSETRRATHELWPSGLPSEPSASPARLSIVTPSMTSFDLLPIEKTWRGELMILRSLIVPDMVARKNCDAASKDEVSCRARRDVGK
jgi:hypothetical protein